MIDTLPSHIGFIFILTTFFTVWLLYKAAHNSKTVLLIAVLWLFLQALVALSGFYLVTDTLPPRIALLGGPMMLLIIGVFASKKGRQFIAGLDLKTLTYLHIIRIPVEIVLLWLYMYKQVPQLMTFEGRNFDILSGLSAPLVGYLFFAKRAISKKVLLAWNLICLALLINIVVNAVFSVPIVFQQFAFDQPNLAILYFPFVWLPCCVVPIVLFAHLVAIRQLLTKP